MPDYGPTYIWDDKDFQNVIQGMRKKCGNLLPAHEIAGRIVHASILRNFEEGGRPTDWPDLAESTKKQREKEGSWPGQILVKNGARGGLMGAVTYDAAPTEVIFSANKIYAAIQHFGGMAGPGRQVKIQSRKYMMIQKEDWAEIQAAIQHFILEV